MSSKLLKLTAEDVVDAIIYGGFSDSTTSIYAGGNDKDGNVVLDVVTGGDSEDETVTTITLAIVKQRKGKF